MNTEKYIRSYLQENITESETLGRMGTVISEFAARAPKILVTKCIDGRVHGSKAKGYPATTIHFGRTDGNNVSTEKNNYWFWHRIENIINNARCNTPEMPAIFIAYMHHSRLGTGCAAHKNNEIEAYKAINEQTRAIKKVCSSDKLYVLEGNTNTDTMAEELIFDESIRLSTIEFIENFAFQNLRDIFHKAFLKYPIKDPATSRFVAFKTPEELTEEPTLLFHSDYQTSLAMKSFLLLEISRILHENDYSSQKLIHPDLFHAILSRLEQVKTLPKSLLAPFFYQSFWNISYALYQKSILEQLSEAEKDKQINHSEELICYGDGFELLDRNKSILVKTGRGDDSNALVVAKEVLENNRNKIKPDYSKIIHLNIEISGELTSWDDFNENISSRMHTMLRLIDSIFGEDINILTTYSYRKEKRFYPIVTLDDKRIINIINIIEGINSNMQFSNMALKSKEALYATNHLL
ncbi:MAG: hypothetical protein H7A25_17195 [Leptospiraceae bacterium]|nr:hypothetical protein [Leptospiraceae bacterium]